jgi:hypothetical protein
MLKKILLALVAVVAILAVVVAFQPSSYRVERSKTIKAPPEVIYGAISDLKRWKAWSPWEQLDPAMKTDYTGEPGQVGHASHWTGNDDVGEGKMTLTAAKVPTALTIRLEFIKPFESVADTGFDLVPGDGGTQVTWWMSGENDFMGKAFSLAMDMDDMIGGDHEKGLAALGKIAETEAASARKAAEQATQRKAAEAAALKAAAEAAAAAPEAAAETP